MKSLNITKISYSTWVLSGLVLSLLLSISRTSMATEGTWIRKADMPTARGLHSASVVDGKIYVIGGNTSEPNPQSVRPVEVYDPITDSWTQKADIPTGRSVLATTVVNGKIYAIGGAAMDFVGHSTLEVYDPATDTWTRKADMPTRRAALSASAVNGKIYVMGGARVLDYLVGLPTVEEYDPATDTWTRKADMPTPRWGLCTSVVDGNIYAIGGGTQSPGRDIVEAYDPATDTWTKKANMPTARRNFATCMVGGRIYAIGGWVTSSRYVFTTVEQYDPVMDTWIIETDLPVPRAVFSANVVDGKIYAIGGTDKTHPCPALSTVYELTISAPTPDFNGDGIVDAVDICMMVDFWGTDEPLYDIAPPPFGDGIVDVEDLKVLAENLFEDYRLVAHWTLDEDEGNTAYDSASENDAILRGGPIWQTNSGMVGGALQFDGIDDYISTPFVLNFGNGSFSVFAWIKGGMPEQVIISQMGDFGSTLININSSGKLMTEFSGIYFGDLESEIIVTDGQWHHVGFVYDMDSLHRLLYVDGILVAEDATVVSGMPSDGGLHIGTSKDLEAGCFFSGLIDDVSIYDQALSTEEITALAQ